MAQTYLVTGANRGLGLEFCRQIAGRGGRVIGTVRDRSKAAELEHVGDQVRVVELDVSDPASIAGLAGRVGDAPIDVLINNAGMSGTSKSIEGLDAAEIAKVFVVNAIAPMLVVKALLPLLGRGERKTVFSITSQLGSIANNTGGSTYSYRGSKAALNQLNRCLANELGPKGYTCVVVHPGWVQTDMGGPQAPLTPAQSVGHMLRTLDGLKQADNGRFLNYDGTGLPW
jgi:NAD(P)-dependent dehydrogenase (short-subunit alcohol dehydrogenase family)